MSEPHIDPPAWSRAYEANFAAYAAALAEAGHGAVMRQDDAVLIDLPGHPYFNGVVSPHFTDGQSLPRIAEIIDVFRRWKSTVRFRLGPSTQPADLSLLFEDSDAAYWGVPYMALDLSHWKAHEVDPPGLELRIVDDYSAFREQPHPLYGYVNTSDKRRLFAAFERLASEQPQRHWMFVAEKDGQAVGASTLYLHEDSAGVYDFEVLDEFRRQGIGTALLQSMCDFA